MLNTANYQRQVIIISDGPSDYLVLKSFLLAIFEPQNNFNFVGDHNSQQAVDKLIGFLNLRTSVDNFVKMVTQQKSGDYSSLLKPINELKTQIIRMLDKVLGLVQKNGIDLSGRDLLIINSDSERPLGNRQNYFQERVCLLDRIFWWAIEEFYNQMLDRRYSHQKLPLILPLILFPSIEILVAAFIEEEHDFDKQCRTLKANPDLKQRVWGTNSIPKAFQTGMLQEVLVTYVTSEALDKVYRNLPEVRKFMQILSFNKT
jgi:hypothetical protein